MPRLAAESRTTRAEIKFKALQSRYLEQNHPLVEVPARPAKPLNAEEVLTRIHGLSSSAMTPRLFQQRLDQFRATVDPEGERAFLDRIC